MLSADELAGDPPDGLVIPPIHLVVLKVTSPCNLNCSYCYVYNGRDRTYLNRPALLEDDIARAALSTMASYCAARPAHQISICLHGGEPLLMGRQRFGDLVILIRDRLGPHLGALAVQTNGVLVDRDWARLLREQQIAVSVSLDGSAAVNDVERVDHAGRGSHARVVTGIRHLLDEGIRPAVLSVARPGASGADTYRYIRSLGITNLDFLLPDVSHDDWQARFAGLGETPVADYLIPALDAWLEENNPDVHIRFFSDIFKLILGGTAACDAFGGGAMPYVVIETDGSIQANDALRVCENSISETGLDVMRHDFEQLNRARPLVRDLISGAIPRPDGCQSCPELTTCGGGYMPHRYSSERGFNNPSVWCADILKLFGYMRSLVEAFPPLPASEPPQAARLP